MSLAGACLLARWCPAWRWCELGPGSGVEGRNLSSRADGRRAERRRSVWRSIQTNAHRLLQGLKPQRLSRALAVRLHWLHVSSWLARSRAGEKFVSFIPAVSDDAGKAIRRGWVKRWRMHFVEPDRTSPTSHGRSTRRRELDQLIRPLLPDRADPDPQGHQRLVGALGHAEVQAVAPPSSAREPVPGGDPNGSLDLFAHWEWGPADG
jgi:hypothetical protein